MVSYSASFWLTNRGVLTAAFMVLMVCFIITGVVGVPAHDYARGYLGGTPYHRVWYMDAFLIPLALMLTFVGQSLQVLRQKTHGRHRASGFHRGIGGCCSVS